MSETYHYYNSCDVVIHFSYNRGNQIVHLKVNIPTKLTEKQKKLIEEFAEEGKEGAVGKKTKNSSENHHNILNEAWKRVKDFLHKSDSKDSKDTSSKASNEKSKEEESAKAKI